MKYLKLIAVGAAMIATLAWPVTPAMAMDGATAAPTSSTDAHSKSVDRKMEKLTTSLNLSADEKARIRPILEQEAAQVKDLRADKSLSKADHSAKLKAIHTETKTKIAAILNTDQQKKFAEMGPGHRSSSANKSS